LTIRAKDFWITSLLAAWTKQCLQNQTTALTKHIAEDGRLYRQHPPHLDWQHRWRVIGYFTSPER
jgi:hypothetical protein